MIGILTLGDKAKASADARIRIRGRAKRVRRRQTVKHPVARKPANRQASKAGAGGRYARPEVVTVISTTATAGVVWYVAQPFAKQQVLDITVITRHIAH